MLSNRYFTKLRSVDDCWVWTGEVHDRGYGRYNKKKVHRLAWEFFRGPIPQGLTIDHLCRVKLCCNPDHMDVVPASVNVSRRWNHEMTSQYTCHRGHQRTEENIYVRPDGRRECLLCKKIVRSAA